MHQRYIPLSAPHADFRTAVAAGQPTAPPTTTFPPPCQVTKLASGASAGSVSTTVGVAAPLATSTRESTRHTPMSQPAHDGDPTVRTELKLAATPRYSCPGIRSMPGPGLRVAAISSRAVFGPRSPITYAVRPAPPIGVQSSQLIVKMLKGGKTETAPGRHAVVPRSSHHAGSVA